jgi:hypothetical protein
MVGISSEVIHQKSLENGYMEFLDPIQIQTVWSLLPLSSILRAACVQSKVFWQIREINLVMWGNKFARRIIVNQILPVLCFMGLVS